MTKEGFIELNGVITSVLGNGNFKVKVAWKGEKESIILAYAAGKLRRGKKKNGSGSFIKVVEGDNVKVEISPYDLTKGRIIYRFSK